MKQKENSIRNSSVSLDKQSSSSDKVNNFQSIVLKRKIIKISLTALSLALVVTIYLQANKGSKFNEENETTSKATLKKIEVEVLDGVGSTRAALFLTNIIRSNGYDVVEMKKNSSGVVDKSYIFDRSGNIDEARKLADAIGIPQDKVFQKVDKNLFLDITVVLGRDFSQLKVFQSHSERNRR